MQVLLGGIGLYGSDRSDFNVVAELVVEGSAPIYLVSQVYLQFGGGNGGGGTL